MCDLCSQHTREEVDEAFERLASCVAELRSRSGQEPGISQALALGKLFRGVEGVHDAVHGIRVPRGQNNHLVGFTTDYLLSAERFEIIDSIQSRILEHGA